MLRRMTTYFRELFENLKALNENFDWHTEALDRYTKAIGEQNERFNELLLKINESTASQRELNSMIVNHLLDRKKLQVQQQRIALDQDAANIETPHDLVF